MLITMRMDAALSKVNDLVKMLLGWGLEVHVMKEKRPFYVAFFGNGTKIKYGKLREYEEIANITTDTGFFKDNREDFERVQSCDNLCPILA